MSVSRAELTPEDRAALRIQLSQRDGKRCFYCGRNFKARPLRRRTFDHYIPHRLWPGWNVANLVQACERCNLAKEDALPLTLAWLLLARFNPDRFAQAA